MCAIENVAVAAATCHRCDLTAVEADGHLVCRLWLGLRGWLCDCATEVKPWIERDREKRLKLKTFDATQIALTLSFIGSNRNSQIRI